MVRLDAAALQIYQRVLSDFALFDLSDHGLLCCVGKEAAQFLHNLCTNEVLKLGVGKSSEAFLTTAQAKIVDHVWILNRGGDEPTRWLDVGPGEASRIFKHLDRFLISEQLEIQDLTGQFAHFHLAGPRALQKLTEAGDQSVQSLQELDAIEVKVDGHQLLIWRRNRLGVPGFDLICSVAETQYWLERLGTQSVGAAGAWPFETLRIEAGLPQFGADITEANLPQEISRIEQTISFTKGCYIGQETVARVRSYGHVNRTLRGLVLPEDAEVKVGDTLLHDGAEVGVVTSCTFSPRLQRPVALAYVRRGHESTGTTLKFGENPNQVAVVSDLPLISSVTASA